MPETNAWGGGGGGFPRYKQKHQKKDIKKKKKAYRPFFVVQNQLQACLFSFNTNKVSLSLRVSFTAVCFSSYAWLSVKGQIQVFLWFTWSVARGLALNLITSPSSRQFPARSAHWDATVYTHFGVEEQRKVRTLLGLSLR